MQTSETTILQPSAVEFRQPTGFGTRVVTVWISRQLAIAEDWRSLVRICGRSESVGVTLPMSLSLSEIEHYTSRARELCLAEPGSLLEQKNASERTEP